MEEGKEPRKELGKESLKNSRTLQEPTQQKCKELPLSDTSDPPALSSNDESEKNQQQESNASEKTTLSQEEAQDMLRQLTSVFSSALEVKESTHSQKAHTHVQERRPAGEAARTSSTSNPGLEVADSHEKAKLDQVFNMWKASKDPNCSPALPHIVTIMMYTSSLYYPLRSHSLDFCLFRCLEYSPSAQGNFELWKKICDLILENLPFWHIGQFSVL